MESNQESDKSLGSKYEAAFCVFMAVLAYLSRDNPSLVYPQILYLFVTLMALNLAAGVALRLWPTREWISAVFILANCGIITAILKYSGGAESNLWVLYLLPIYTVCLLLGAREVVWITLGAIGFNAGFLIVEFAAWNSASTFQLLLESGIFILSAALTWKIVERDRTSRRTLHADRTEIRNLQELTQMQTVRLNETEKLAEVGLLSSGIAHDLNNTFTVILGLTDIVLQTEASTPETKDDLDQIRKSVILGKNILANFVGLAKKEKLALTPCDLHEILQSILMLLHAAVDQGKIKLHFELGQSLPSVMGSRTHLQRLFLNLITNSIKVMKGGGTITIRTEFAETQGRMPPQIRVFFEDSGPGIPDEILANIFTPFSTTMEAQGGTGLGLYICSEIAKQHGGRLHAENKPGGGARFLLCLAIASGKPEVSAPPNGALPKRDTIAIG